MPEGNETVRNGRNFGQEVREAAGNRSEQRRLLREMVMQAAGVDEDTARKAFDSIHDAGLVIVTEEGWEQGEAAIRSLQELNAMVDALHSES